MQTERRPRQESHTTDDTWSIRFASGPAATVCLSPNPDTPEHPFRFDTTLGHTGRAATLEEGREVALRVMCNTLRSTLAEITRCLQETW
jgi:hypothetical protein